jgi:hypothetical protein
MARLWQAAYPRWKMELLRLSMLLRDSWSRGEGQSYWKTAFAEARRFTDARSYLQDIARACEPDGPLFSNMDGD